jgi:nitrogen fixation NifU-like protein
MYSPKLLDHYRYSSFKGLHTKYDVVAKMRNPSCGDEVTLTALVENNIIKEIRFEGAGCVISQAAASMLCEFAVGKSQQDLTLLTVNDMLSLVDLKLGPVRARCAYLPLEALKEGFRNDAQSS